MCYINRRHDLDYSCCPAIKSNVTLLLLGVSGSGEAPFFIALLRAGDGLRLDFFVPVYGAGDALRSPLLLPIIPAPPTPCALKVARIFCVASLASFCSRCFHSA